MKIFNSYLSFMDDEGHKGQESTLSFDYINALRIQNSDSTHKYKGPLNIGQSVLAFVATNGQIKAFCT